MARIVRLCVHRDDTDHPAQRSTGKYMQEKKPDGVKTRPLVQRVGNWVMGVAFAMLLTGMWVAEKPDAHPLVIAVVFIIAGVLAIVSAILRLTSK